MGHGSGVVWRHSLNTLALNTDLVGDPSVVLSGSYSVEAPVCLRGECHVAVCCLSHSMVMVGVGGSLIAVAMQQPGQQNEVVWWCASPLVPHKLTHKDTFVLNFCDGGY
ncbi:hypothetical protein E2C01_021601 [Portunus trituberculatus]|uniref:Uncharacterized protein n=1 Tax=Portunus trituberculatus TaxID=210409 RepID=A0A5B7E4X6_PORTR|nr:hypothetical protein [Portunus trituberculatus]